MSKVRNQTLPSITHLNEHAVLLEWPEKICEQQHTHIVNCQLAIKQTLAKNCIETIVSYASLVVYYRFDYFIEQYGANATHHLTALLHNIIEGVSSTEITTSTTTNMSVTPDTTHNIQNLIEIPVYYGEEAGWDIDDVARQTSLSVEAVIKKHTQTTFRAFALGFTPGFCYLGTLPTELALPRKESPRVSVPKGAVAIAEQQTAIYPNNSPGGWHIIGQTPINMTSIGTTTHHFQSTLSVGDTVKFVAISKAEFLTLGGCIQPEQNATSR